MSERLWSQDPTEREIWDATNDRYWRTRREFEEAFAQLTFVRRVLGDRNEVERLSPEQRRRQFRVVTA
jgi:hypothetical protein